MGARAIGLAMAAIRGAGRLDEIMPETEIWPSSTLFQAGESLGVAVKGMDIYRESLPNLPFARHEDKRNRGTHIIHTGGRFDSHLLVPVIEA